MSKFNKCTVAVAVAMALGLPVTAMAATAGYATGTNSTYARNIINSNTQTITTPALFPITVQTSDNIVGRTTGFGVRFTLGNSARFNAAPTLNVGTQLGGGTNWSVGAGTLGSSNSQVVYSVQPQAGATGITAGAGNLLNFAANGVTLTNLVTALGGTGGGTVPVTIELFDSNTNQVLITLNSTFASSVEGTTVTIDTTQGDVNKRIDVATCTNATPTVGPKRRFSPSGAVGNSCGAADTDRLEFNAGAIIYGIAQAGSPASAVRADGFTGANNSGSPGAGNFQYDAANDTVAVTVTGTDFTAFNPATGNDRIYLTAANTCDLANALPGTRTINASNNSITLSNTVANLGGGATGGTVFVCFATTSAVASQIAQQSLNAGIKIDFAATTVADPADRSGALLPLLFNGTVLEFQNVNPAANATAQSFLRFTNNSSIDCPVTLEGVDDAGAAGTSAITFTLASRKSMQINSDVLESGGAGLTGSFGNGAGKWYVTTTAECGQFVGSALNRNNTDGTVTNLTPDKR